MKFASVAVLIATASLALAWDIDDAKIKELSDGCVAEFPVDLTVFEKVMNGDEVDLTVFDKKNYRCYLRCMQIKTGVISETGEPNVEVIKKQFEIGDDVIAENAKCYSENTDTDLCDKAFNTQICVMHNVMKKL